MDARRPARRRVRLSQDTIQTLPEYTFPPAGWSKPLTAVDTDDDDRPPEYEADADTTDDDEHIQNVVVYLPAPSSHPSSPSSPRRSKRHTRKRQSVSDPYLDSLLERSVHALEMSNVLLQTSMSTQSSLSALLAPDSPADQSLEAHARNLSSRIHENRNVHDNWLGDIEEITKGVEGLLGGDEGGDDIGPLPPLSRSFPSSSKMSNLRHRRRPSLDTRKSTGSMSQLQYSHPDRESLVAPAPRAITLHVESNADPDSIVLPSTLGLRSSSPHLSDWRSPDFSKSSSQAPAQPLSGISDSHSDHASPAYNILSSLAKRSGSATPPLNMPSPRLFTSSKRRGSNSTSSTERGSQLSRSPPPRFHLGGSPDSKSFRRRLSGSRSRSSTPRRRVSPPPSRVMTPPIEELSASSSSDTSSDAHPTAFRTVQSLRKILDEQPSCVSLGKAPAAPKHKSSTSHLRPPAFFPRSPPPTPSYGTSTATASISRLYTKGRHSTRPPSPPKHSALKIRSVPPTPTPSPTMMSLPDMIGNGVAKALGSASSSGVSTPKRISFAELPESYASSRPEGSSQFKAKKARSRSRKRAGKQRSTGAGEGEGEHSGWTSWLLGLPGSSGVGFGVNPVKQEERFEDRMARGWSNRPGFGTLDDWAV